MKGADRAAESTRGQALIEAVEQIGAPRLEFFEKRAEGGVGGTVKAEALEQPVRPEAVKELAFGVGNSEPAQDLARVDADPGEFMTDAVGGVESDFQPLIPYSFSLR